MRCTMCNYEFEEADMNCHAACPLGAGCMVICCPRCGYSTVNPNRAKSARWLQRFFSRKNREVRAVASGAVSLLDLQPGQVGQVVEIGGGQEGQEARSMHLSQYGLTPGTPVRLCQKRPVAIVQVGQTDLALDSSVAAEIFVEF